MYKAWKIDNMQIRSVYSMSGYKQSHSVLWDMGRSDGVKEFSFFAFSQDYHSILKLCAYKKNRIHVCYDVYEL